MYYLQTNTKRDTQGNYSSWRERTSDRNSNIQEEMKSINNNKYVT